MEFLDGCTIRKHILESYSRQPKGWSFIVSRSPKSGFYDGVVSGPEGTWLLKMDSIFKPSPITLGSYLTDSNSRPVSSFPYGYRQMPRDLVLRLLHEESPYSSNKGQADILSFLKLNPVVPEPGRGYAEGPIVFTSPENVELSVSQRQIDARLTSEMHRLLRARYPAYG